MTVSLTPLFFFLSFGLGPGPSAGAEEALAVPKERRGASHPLLPEGADLRPRADVGALKERIPLQEAWRDIAWERPGIKEEIRFLAIASEERKAPREPIPGWPYGSPFPAFVLKLFQGEEAYYKEGLYRFLEGRYREAVEAWELLLGRYPKGQLRSRASYWMGEAYYRMKDNWRALGAYSQALIEGRAGDKYRAYTHLAQGWIYLQGGEYERALSSFHALVEIKPRLSLTAIGHYLKGGSLLNLGRYEQASAAYSRSLELYPTGPLAAKALFWKAESLYHGGQYAPARNLYAHFLARYRPSPLSEQALYSLGWCQLGLKDAGGACRTWEQFAASYPHSGLLDSALIGKIRAFLIQRDLAAAQRTYRHLLTRRPESPWRDHALFELAAYRFEKEELGPAILAMEELLRSFPATPLRPTLLFLLGESFYRMGAYRTALSYYQRLAKEYATDPAWGPRSLTRIEEIQPRIDPVSLIPSSISSSRPQARPAAPAPGSACCGSPSPSGGSPGS
ncbi:MAG: tetratricopeptide repeat protein [Candidatus Tectomicrobia bacterium]|uniref:Tetratricopeptide repeat protein n=1 Tax=Tectimicrobiota bacterium TaxID=2528274 RepID=A0A932CRC2_UNCTE|nr:tetratricopeptide repeat protein [Candidatus Tectomicrobia bacterium]